MQRAMESTSDRQALRALISLLQETIPVQHISIAAAEHPGSQAEPFESAAETEITEAMRQLYRLFRGAGHSAEEAKRRLSTHSPFDQFPDLIAALDTSS
jgi:hypothetical protein